LLSRRPRLRSRLIRLIRPTRSLARDAHPRERGWAMPHPLHANGMPSPWGRAHVVLRSPPCALARDAHPRERRCARRSSPSPRTCRTHAAGRSRASGRRFGAWRPRSPRRVLP